MVSTIADRPQKYNEFNVEFKELQGRNLRCSESAGHLLKRKEQVLFEVGGIEEERRDLINRVAVGEELPEELAKVNERLRAKKIELDEADELHEAASLAQKEAAEGMTNLRFRRLNRCEEEIWRQVRIIEIDRAKAEAIPAIRRAFVAYRRAGSSGDFMEFLKECFGISEFAVRTWGDENINIARSMVEEYDLPFNG